MVRSWTVDLLGSYRIGVAATGLVLPKGLDPLRALEIARRVEGALAIQLLHWRRVMGPLHLLQASLLAYKAFREGRMASRSLSMELLLYAAGEKQIKDAIDKLGVKEERAVIVSIALSEAEARMAVLKALEALGAEEEDGLMDASLDKLAEVGEAFKVGQEEVEASVREGGGLVEAMVKCVLSRVAELDLEKEA